MKPTTQYYTLLYDEAKKYPWRLFPNALKVESEVAQLCPTLWDPMDCSPPGSSVHRILQARILKRVAILFSRGSFQPRIRPGSPVLQMDSLPSEPPGMSPRLKSTGLGCSAARGIFPNQGPNLCLLHW